MAVVITSNNFGTRGMHEQTEKLLTNYILVAVAQGHRPLSREFSTGKKISSRFQRSALGRDPIP
jgi:hypothetical protein